MLIISPTNQFKKDVKISQKRNKDFTKFKEIIEFLIWQKPLPEKYKDHKLKGDYLGSRECHIEPDWLLIYRVENDYLILIRLGSHSDLFR